MKVCLQSFFSLFVLFFIAGCGTGATAPSQEQRKPSAVDFRDMSEDLARLKAASAQNPDEISGAVLSMKTQKLSRMLHVDNIGSGGVYEAALAGTVENSGEPVKLGQILSALYDSTYALGYYVDEETGTSAARRKNSILNANKAYFSALGDIYSHIKTMGPLGAAVGDLLVKAKSIAYGEESRENTELFTQIVNRMDELIKEGNIQTSEEALDLALAQLKLDKFFVSQFELDIDDLPSATLDANATLQTPSTRHELLTIFSAYEDEINDRKLRADVNELIAQAERLGWSRTDLLENMNRFYEGFEIPDGISKFKRREVYRNPTLQEATVVLSRLQASDDFEYILKAIKKAQATHVLVHKAELAGILSFIDAMVGEDQTVFSNQDAMSTQSFSVSEMNELKKFFEPYMDASREAIISKVIYEQFDSRSKRRQIAAIIVKNQFTKKDVLIRWNRFLAKLMKKYADVRVEYRIGRRTNPQHAEEMRIERDSAIRKWIEKNNFIDSFLKP